LAHHADCSQIIRTNHRRWAIWQRAQSGHRFHATLHRLISCEKQFRNGSQTNFRHALLKRSSSYGRGSLTYRSTDERDTNVSQSREELHGLPHTVLVIDPQTFDEFGW